MWSTGSLTRSTCSWLILILGLDVGVASAQEPATRIQSVSTPSIAQPHTDDWPTYGLDYREQRHSPLKGIDRSSVSRLGLAWYFDTDYARGVEATAVVVDGVAYVTGSWSVVYALDARSGQLLWKFDPNVPKSVGASACCDVVNRGVAVYEGKVFFGALDTRLFALDAKTGAKLWEVTTADRSKAEYTSTGAPRVAKGKVFIGNGGGEFGVRGYVSAYDVNTGALIWRFYTVPGHPSDPETDETQAMAAKTWTGKWWQYGGGGTVWDSIVYDPELDKLYIGTGNGSPWNRKVRSPEGGDNLFLSSIVALEPDTGKYVWHYQEVPAETWDYTATQTIILGDMAFGGRERKVIWHAPKNGYFYVIDRADGKLLSAQPYSRQTWSLGYDMNTGRPIENPKADWTQSTEEVSVIPGAAGAHNWPPMAYSPQTKLVYIPEQTIPWVYQSLPLGGVRRGTYNVGTVVAGLTTADPLLFDVFMRTMLKGALVAWDPVQQKAAWRVEHGSIANGGILTTAGGLVFQGADETSSLVAYDAQNGTALWSFPTQDAPVAAPMSYAVDGEQYILVGVGRGGTSGLMPRPRDTALPPKGRFMAFKLGAQAQLPAPTPRVDYGDPPAPIDRSEATFDAGEKLFREYCVRCHTLKGVGNGRLPDLRRLPRAMYDSFDAIVRDGAVEGLGMPRFGHLLKAEELAALKTYLLVEAEKDRALRNQPSWWVAIKRTGYELLAKVLVRLM